MIKEEPPMNADKRRLELDKITETIVEIKRVVYDF